MKNFGIIEYAEEVSAKISSDLAREPENEIIILLEVALRRESLVSEAYNENNITSHLAQLPFNEELKDKIRSLILSAWAQEKAHQAFLNAIFSSIIPRKEQNLRKTLERKIQKKLGTIEGFVLAKLSSPSLPDNMVAKLIVALGRLGRNAPPFLDQLRITSFMEFCVLNYEMEHTAEAGYRRMLELLGQLEKTNHIDSTTLKYDLSKILRDEKYHKELFHFLSQLNTMSRNEVSSSFADKLFAIQRSCYETEISVRGIANQRTIESRAKEILTFDERKIVSDPLIKNIHAFLNKSPS